MRSQIYIYIYRPSIPVVHTVDYSPVWRVLFGACEFDAYELGGSHFGGMPVWLAAFCRVFQFGVNSLTRFASLARFLHMLTNSALHKEMMENSKM